MGCLAANKGMHRSAVGDHRFDELTVGNQLVGLATVPHTHLPYGPAATGPSVDTR
jgi:hypothetical protein